MRAFFLRAYAERAAACSALFFALRPDFRQISCVLPDLLSKERLLHHPCIRKQRFRIKFGMTKPSVHAVERKTAPQPPSRARKVRFCAPAPAFSDQAELGAKKIPATALPGTEGALLRTVARLLRQNQSQNAQMPTNCPLGHGRFAPRTGARLLRPSRT